MLRRYVVTSLLLLTATRLNAQDTIRAPIDTLSVTVTRTALPQTTAAAVSVLKTDRIQGSKATVNLDESLVEVPGVVVINRYNYSQGPRISVRGFGSRAAFGVRGVRIIQDGIPLTMPDGQATLNNVDLAATGRIEVIRGSASSLYGNASGGVISLRTELPTAGLNAEARVLAGTTGRGAEVDLQKYNLKLGGGSARTRFTTSGSFTTTNGYRDRSRFEQYNVNGRVMHDNTALSFSWARSPFAEDPGALPRDSAERFPEAAAPRNVLTKAGKIGSQTQIGLTRSANFAGGSLQAGIYGVARELVNPQTFAYIDLRRRAGGFRSTIEWPHLMLGVDADAQHDRRHEYATANGSPGAATRNQIDNVRTLGPFARADWSFGKLNLISGARYDWSRFSIDDLFLSDGRDDSTERTMSALSPTVGVTFAPTFGHTLYANYSTSFQTPTTTEINNSIDPLDPERARSFEVGARVDRNGIAVDFALYQLHIKDELVPFQVATSPGRNFFRNAAETRHRGFEVSGQARLTPAVEVATSYTYSDFVFVDDGNAAQKFEGHKLPGIAPHHLFGRVTARVKRLQIEPQFEWNSDFHVDDGNTESAKNHSYAILHMQWRVTVLHAEVLGGITNLTNKRYNGSVVINAAGGRYYEPAPGRALYLGLKKILLQNRRSA